MSGYWDRRLEQRISRRRALAGAGAAAAGAAVLAACGGDDGGGEGGRAASGQIFKPVDTTNEAKRGGTWRANITADPANFDLHNFNATLQPFCNVIGSQLVKVAPTINRNGTAGHELEVQLAIEGDVAESWEFSPDKLTLTMKIHPEAKWAPLSSNFHSGAPSTIGGRNIDADDVVFGWDRMKVTPTAAGRLELARDASPSGMVTSLTKIDNRTIQMKLDKPASPLLSALATWNVGYFYIMPKEGRDQPNDFFQRFAFGGGPFYIDRFEPSVGITLKRNPLFELRDPKLKRPFVDQVNLPVVADAAAREAQFRGGNLFNVFFASVDDTLRAKQDIPQLLLLTGYVNQGEVLEFGVHKDSPWKDVRVRQAISMAWNRDEFIVGTMSTDKLEANGIPANVRWAAGLSGNEQGYPNGTYKGYWLDPQGKEFGENAKYFQYAPDEAKKLLAAAGFPNGITADHLLGFGFPTTQLAMDVLNGMLVDVGIKLTRKQLTAAENNELTITDYPGPGGGTRNWGNYVGIHTVIDSGGPDPASYIHQMYHKNGGRFRGYNPNSTGASVDGDPVINDIVDNMFAEFDEKKRIELAHDFQRHHAKMAYRFRYPGCATTLSVWWPAVANLGVYNGESFKRLWTNEWLDQTKPPFA